MRVLDGLEALRSWRSAIVGRVGFVPTMGALHEGHLSLARRARTECDVVVVSIFVNPTQFGAGEDLEQYPRTLRADLAQLEAERADAVFTPTVETIYPRSFSTWVSEETLTGRWEGASRPGHFRGVTTVVLKLINLVRPERVFFGEKDYQQLRVVERMVHDLNVGTTVVPCPTVREADGLAMSSRNVKLAPAEREAATVLWRALDAGRRACADGQRDGPMLARVVEDVIRTEPLAELDYVAVVDPRTLAPVERVDDRGAACLVAARVGPVRLIDNMLYVPRD